MFAGRLTCSAASETWGTSAGTRLPAITSPPLDVTVTPTPMDSRVRTFAVDNGCGYLLTAVQRTLCPGETFSYDLNQPLAERQEPQGLMMPFTEGGNGPPELVLLRPGGGLFTVREDVT